RLYVTFVGKGSDTSDDTDIFLATSDDGGQTWQTRGAVNDDRRVNNGFSGRDRAQFMPEVAVDQATGTLGASRLDARCDPSRARVATFIASSLDGGVTWSPQTYANVPNSALDVVTGDNVNLEPIPDNMSVLNAQRDAAFGMGDRQ